MSNNKVIAIVGPTAVGKSKIADLLANELNSAVLSCDSMQIYKGMDIGTAKIDSNQTLSPHFGLDLVDVDEPFSVARFQKYGREICNQLLQKYLIPVLCGGTNLYTKAILDDMQFPEGEQVNNPVRRKYEKLHKTLGNKGLHDLLKKKDPQSAAKIHPNNVRRVIRAFEMLEEGISYANQKKDFKETKPYYDSFVVALLLERTILYEKINNRVDLMMKQGLLNEVQNLLNSYGASALTATQAIGYKELVSYLNGEINPDEATNLIKKRSRNYAKRQLSWIRQSNRIHAIDTTDKSIDTVFAEILPMVNDFLK